MSNSYEWLEKSGSVEIRFEHKMWVIIWEFEGHIITGVDEGFDTACDICYMKVRKWMDKRGRSS